MPTANVSVEAIQAASEDGNVGSFRVSRTGSTTNALTVNIGVSGTATNGTDYATIGSTVVIPAAAASVDILLTPTDDDILDADETVVVTVDTGTGYTPTTPTAATVGILDNIKGSFAFGSNVGLIKYDIPFDEIDPDDPSQSVGLDNFELFFDGQTFTGGFTMSPTVEVSYGELGDIAFALTFPSRTLGYDAISVSGGDVTGDKPSPSPDDVVGLQVDQAPLLALDFSTVEFKHADYDMNFVGYYVGNTNSGAGSINIPQSGTAGANAEAVRDAFFNEAKRIGLLVEKSGTTGIIIRAPAGKKLQNLYVFSNWSGTTGPKKVAVGQGNGPVEPTYTHNTP